MIGYLSSSAKALSLISIQLGREDYGKLLACRSGEEFVELLAGNAGYADVLSGVSVGPLPAIGKILEDHLIGLFHKLIPHCPIQAQRFLKALLTRYEIRNLKILIRARQAGSDPAGTIPLLFDLGPYSGIDGRKLSAVSSLEDLIESLKKTPYYQALVDANVIHLKTGSLYPFDMALDWFFLQNLHRKSLALGAADQQAVHRIIFTQIDLYNIVNVYRANYFYHLSHDEITSIHLNYKYNLQMKEIDELVSASSPEAFGAIIGKTPYRLLLDETGGINPIFFETRMNRILLKQAGNVKSGLPFGLGVLLATLLTAEFEVRDLIAMWEGIKAGLPTDQIRRFLIRNQG
jgi:V/A-type H+/Na+-transporting ATPase subunit C